MTMQTTPLPFQVSGAAAPAQPQAQLQAQLQRQAAAGVQAPDPNRFGATLSREIAQRQAMPLTTGAPSPAPANTAANKPPAPARQQGAEKPAAQGQGPKAAAREPARQNEAASDAPATAQAGAAGSADDATDATSAEQAAAAAEAATTPVTDMLAFMASLARPAQAAAPVAADAAATTAGSAELQLAALQSAFAKLDTQDAAAGTDPAAAAAAEDKAGFSLAAGTRPADDRAADLRALQQDAQAAKPATVADPGKLQGQAREAASQAAANVDLPAPGVTQLQAQAARLEAVANPAAVPGDRIPARMGTQAWDNQVSQRIVYMVGKEQAATLTLNPPDLGPVQVVLNVSNDQASVAFSSSQLEVRQALENALPRLREMMSESGIALGNATVDAGVPDGRHAQDGERRGNGGSGGNGSPGNGNVADANDNAARPVTRTVALGDSGMVDTFA